MRIAFLIADQSRKYEGVVRPFLNFVKGFENKSEVSFALLRCGNDLIDHLRSEFDAYVSVSDTQKDLIRELDKLRPQFVVADDHPSRLKLLNGIKANIMTNVVVYVQVLYGIHSVSNSFDLSFLPLNERLLFSLLRFVPFSVLSRRYSNLIRGRDLVLANSNVTAMLLHALYDLDVGGVVYPPTDIDVFKPTISSEEGSKEIVLYLGSHLGDTERDFVEKIVERVAKYGKVVNVFGNSRLALILKSEYDEAVVHHVNLKDEELADIYSRSLITVCPQKWEQFGLVPVESMACGTPVLAFNYMGFQETIINGETGWLANREKEFLYKLNYALEKGVGSFSKRSLREHVVEKFSIAASVEKLDRFLRNNNET